MEENTLSQTMDNIAVRMLTEYRTQVLQETGAEWFHAENAFWWLSKSASVPSSVRAFSNLCGDPTLAPAQ